jgi:hypothetical protein
MTEPGLNSRRTPVIAGSKRAMDDYLLYNKLRSPDYAYVSRPSDLNGQTPGEILIIGWPDLRTWEETLAMHEALGTKITYSAAAEEENLQL